MIRIDRKHIIKRRDNVTTRKCYVSTFTLFLRTISISQGIVLYKSNLYNLLSCHFCHLKILFKIHSTLQLKELRVKLIFFGLTYKVRMSRITDWSSVLPRKWQLYIKVRDRKVSQEQPCKLLLMCFSFLKCVCYCFYTFLTARDNLSLFAHVYKTFYDNNNSIELLFLCLKFVTSVTFYWL